jgi:hypothetical protein
MSKYDKKIMDIVVDGVKKGELIKKRTAEEYSKEHWELARIKRLFYQSIESCKNKFKTPIFESKWERKGLYYYKTKKRQIIENGMFVTVYSKLFCITYWFLKRLHPGKY